MGKFLVSLKTELIPWFIPKAKLAAMATDHIIPTWVQSDHVTINTEEVTSI